VRRRLFARGQCALPRGLGCCGGAAAGFFFGSFSAGFFLLLSFSDSMGMAVKLGDQQKQVPPGVGVTMPLAVGVGTEHAVRCTPLVWTEKNLRTHVCHIL
jgi:hypothetical protein